MDHVTLRKVRTARFATQEAVVVTLFRDRWGDVCGWYLGPVCLKGDGISLPYLPRSEGVLGAVAVVRALEAADAVDLEVCIFDPDDLWDAAWAT